MRYMLCHDTIMEIPGVGLTILPYCVFQAFPEAYARGRFGDVVRPEFMRCVMAPNLWSTGTTDQCQTQPKLRATTLVLCDIRCMAKLCRDRGVKPGARRFFKNVVCMLGFAGFCQLSEVGVERHTKHQRAPEFVMRKGATAFSNMVLL